jgi:hypothetical protein
MPVPIKSARKSSWVALSTAKRWGLIATGVVASLLFVAACAVVLLRWAPGALAPDSDVSSERAEEISSARSALLVMLGGLIAVATAIYTVKTFRLSRQGQITDRLTRAVDQLGNEAVDIRLGGIFALERLARESPGDHSQIMEILTGFVRERSPWVDGLPHPAAGAMPPALKQPQSGADIQAAIQVIGRRNAKRDAESAAWVLDLSAVDLRGATLARGNFTGAIFHEAHLEGADLSGTDLSHLEATDAHFDGADLTGARLDGSILANAHLRGAELRFAQLKRTNLRDADLRGANLFSATLDMADLWKANLTGASLWNARLANADLTDAVLEQAMHNSSTVWPTGFSPSQH